MRFFSTQMYCEGSEELMEQHALEPSQIQIRQGKEKKFMRNVIAKLDMAVSENYDFGTLPERKDFISSVAKKGNSFILVLDLNKILESIENEIDSKH